MCVQHVVDLNDLVAHDVRVDALGRGGGGMAEELRGVLLVDVVAGHDTGHVVSQAMELGADAEPLCQCRIAIGEGVRADGSAGRTGAEGKGSACKAS